MAAYNNRRKTTRVSGSIEAWHLPPPSFPVVQIPRAQWGAQYWALPWPHLYALAASGQNGLSVTTKNVEHPHAPAECVWMREGDQGQSLLYHQNWR